LKRDAEAIDAVAKREEAQALIVGVPLGDAGEAEKMAKAALKLAETLTAMGWTVHTVNEAMTSVEAEANLRRDGGNASARRKLRDGEAARLIVERFFDEQDRA
jgi:putative transcription antitermination factor YqgF